MLGLCLAATVPLEFPCSGCGSCVTPTGSSARFGLPVVVFVVWDIVAIDRGTWWYNDRYVTGWEVPFGLPGEELVFFLVIPLVGVLSYEAVQRVLGGRGG